MWLSSVRSVLPLSAAPASLLTNSGVVSRALAATTSWSSMSCSAAKGHAGSPGLYRRWRSRRAWRPRGARAVVSRSSAPRAPASSSQRGKERGALRGHNTRRLRHELGGGPVNLAGVRSALPVPVSPWPPRAAHRPAAARREIQGVHSGGEMGYQGANIWPMFANE
eukprot:scaffold79285_cov30-Phaeocystis_antarctica.AAC.1